MFLTLHLALPMPQKSLNSRKEWARYGVFGQCLMTGELKPIKISSFKIFDRYIFACGIQISFVKH
jgi:hypothetical protein